MSGERPAGARSAAKSGVARVCMEIGGARIEYEGADLDVDGVMRMVEALGGAAPKPVADPVERPELVKDELAPVDPPPSIPSDDPYDGPAPERDLAGTPEDPGPAFEDRTRGTGGPGW